MLKLQNILPFSLGCFFVIRVPTSYPASLDMGTCFNKKFCPVYLGKKKK